MVRAGAEGLEAESVAEVGAGLDEGGTEEGVFVAAVVELLPLLRDDRRVETLPDSPPLAGWSTPLSVSETPTVASLVEEAASAAAVAG